MKYVLKKGQSGGTYTADGQCHEFVPQKHYELNAAQVAAFDAVVEAVNKPKPKPKKKKAESKAEEK